MRRRGRCRRYWNRSPGLRPTKSRQIAPAGRRLGFPRSAMRLLDRPDHEVGPGGCAAEASELGGDLAAVVGRVVDHVAKDGPEGQRSAPGFRGCGRTRRRRAAPAGAWRAGGQRRRGPAVEQCLRRRRGWATSASVTPRGDGLTVDPPRPDPGGVGNVDERGPDRGPAGRRAPARTGPGRAPGTPRAPADRPIGCTQRGTSGRLAWESWGVLIGLGSAGRLAVAIPADRAPSARAAGPALHCTAASMLSGIRQAGTLQ